MKLTISTLDNTSTTAGVRAYKANCVGVYDPQNAVEVAPSGVDCAPALLTPALKVVYSDTVRVGKSVNLGVINTNQKAAPGECRFYSQNSGGVEQVKVWLHSDGKVEIGGTSDSVNANHAVQWEALNTQMQSAIVNFINTQLPLIATGISMGGGSYTPGTMALDISSAKEEDILLP